jgi:hypothetical protein
LTTAAAYTVMTSRNVMKTCTNKRQACDMTLSCWHAGLVNLCLEGTVAVMLRCLPVNVTAATIPCCLSIGFALWHCMAHGWAVRQTEVPLSPCHMAYKCSVSHCQWHGHGMWQDKIGCQLLCSNLRPVLNRQSAALQH